MIQVYKLFLGVDKLSTSTFFVLEEGGQDIGV